MRMTLLLGLLMVFAIIFVPAGAIGAAIQPAPVFVIGGAPVLSRGAAHRVAVVAVMTTGQVAAGGQPRLATDQDVVFVVRNNTGHPVHEVRAEAVVVDAAGRPLAEEADLGIAPSAVRAGGLAFGWFSFTGSSESAFPGGSKLRITAAAIAGPPPAAVDLRVTAARAVQLLAGVAGSAVNDTGHRVEGPLSVSYVCFNPANHITAFTSDVRTDVSWALPNQRVTFDETPTSWSSTALHRSAGKPCAHALVSVSGVG